ncbi:MAG: S-layer homology domain-containing protein [Cellulosilyticaceae bacterium]
MNLKKFNKIMLSLLVGVVAVSSSVTYGQSNVGTLYENKEIKEDAQLIVKPGFDIIELNIGDRLDHEILKNHVMYDDGSVLPDGYVFEALYGEGEELFSDDIAINEGKASIRVKVKGTSHDYSAITHACLDVIIQDMDDVKPEVPETSDKIVEHIPYIKGYEDNTFRADRSISREEVATMVSRLILNGQTITYKNQYKDISDNRYSAVHAAHLKDLKIMTGDNSGFFRPHESLTRGEMAVIIAKTVKEIEGTANKLQSNIFDDVSKNNWAYESICFVTENGLMSGDIIDGKLMFRPTEMLTRAEAVTTLNRVFNRECIDVTINNPYKDLENNHWAYGDILYASIIHQHIIK